MYLVNLATELGNPDIIINLAAKGLRKAYYYKTAEINSILV